MKTTTVITTVELQNLLLALNPEDEYGASLVEVIDGASDEEEGRMVTYPGAILV